MSNNEVNYFTIANGVDGQKGDRGANGKSAYDLYCELHKEYVKSESEWIEDLAYGRLREITITFDTKGGTFINSITTSFGSYINVTPPKKNGYTFGGWTINGSSIDINTYVFMSDCELVAKWSDARFVNVSFDTAGGVVVPSTISIEYGEEYSLPTPEKEYQTFTGWFYGATGIPMTGTWDYTHEDIILTAKWNTSKIYMNLEVDEEYGYTPVDRVAIEVGDKFTLPVPSSIKEGYSFTGWYLDTEKLTNESGESLNVCKWTSSINIRASYYIEIATIYDLMALSGKNLRGNYLITKDLDFNGLGMSNIASIAQDCVFDGGNHTIKNCVLSTDATNVSPNEYATPYSGFIKKTYGTVCNLTIENMTCNEQYSSGLVGNAYRDSLIENVVIKDSFNDYAIRSVLIGSAWGSSEKVGTSAYRNTVYVKNVHIVNSGNVANTIGIYTQSPAKVSDSGNTGKAWYYYPDIDIDGFYVDGLNNSIQNAGAVFYYLASNQATASFSANYYPQKTITIKNIKINGNIKNGIVGRVDNYYCMYSKITVSRAEINGNTETAWSRVTSLSDAILNGRTTNWGATTSVHCIDAQNEDGQLSKNTITSSIVLFPDANGSFTYYTSSGAAKTFDDASAINKDLLVSMLGFDESIWNLEEFNYAEGIYPSIR